MFTWWVTIAGRGYLYLREYYVPKVFSDTVLNIIFEYQLNIRLHRFSVNCRALPLASWYHSGGGGGMSVSFLAPHRVFCVYVLITALQDLKGQFQKWRSQEGIALDKKMDVRTARNLQCHPNLPVILCRQNWGSRRRGVKVTQLDSCRLRASFLTQKYSDLPNC